MSQQTGFAVPKDRQEVVVSLEGSDVLEGAIFLEYAPPGQTVHHKIVSFLDDGNSFFPLVLNDGSGTAFVQKKNLRLLELRYDDSHADLALALSLMQTVQVTVVFVDGIALTGALMAEVPVEKARLSDCLNLPHAFLSLKMDSRICYINKGSLQKVVYA